MSGLQKESGARLGSQWREMACSCPGQETGRETPVRCCLSPETPADDWATLQLKRLFPPQLNLARNTLTDTPRGWLLGDSKFSQVDHEDV